MRHETTDEAERQGVSSPGAAGYAADGLYALIDHHAHKAQMHEARMERWERRGKPQTAARWRREMERHRALGEAAARALRCIESA